jgi:hypothetical protein
MIQFDMQTLAGRIQTSFYLGLYALRVYRFPRPVIPNVIPPCSDLMRIVSNWIVNHIDSYGEQPVRKGLEEFWDSLEVSYIRKLLDILLASPFIQCGREWWW